MTEFNKYMHSTSSCRVHVSELQIGMYVSSLDRDWLETPFLVQGFVIETLDDIDLLAEYCEHVWVDQQLDHLSASRKQLSQFRKGVVTPTIHNIPADKTLRGSVQLQREASETAVGMLRSLRMGGALRSDEASSTVRQCVRNVMNDPGVALLVSRMQSCGDELVDHGLSVCTLAVSMGKFIGLLPAELEKLGLCALLHDVGKVKLSTELLARRGRFSDEDFRAYQLHCEYGRNILAASKNLYSGAVDVAYSHHERIDGQGYPRKLKSGGINDYSRIVAICNAYDNLTRDFASQSALPSTEALIQLLGGRNSLYDAELVDQFQKMVGLYPPGTIVELLNGHVGIVLAKNYRYQHLPRVLVVLDGDKQPVRQRVIDLAKTGSGQLDNAWLIHRACVDGSFGVQLADYLAKGLRLQELGE